MGTTHATARPAVGPAIGEWWSRISSEWRYCLVVYCATRVVVALALVTRAFVGAKRVTATSLAEQWDGWWYVNLARHGYSASLRPPVPGFHHHYSDWAFFPVFPLTIRAVHAVTRLPYPVAGVVLSLAFGLAAVRVMYALGERVRPGLGRPSAVLVCVWPASAVFGLPYSEGLYVAAAGVALVALLDARWMVAGVSGAIASGTRASGVAVIAAAAATAGYQLVRKRDAAALVAPVLAAGGLVAFLAFGWVRTGDPLAWRHAENLWSQQFDLGLAMYRGWTHIYVPGRPIHFGAILQLVGAVGLLAFLVAGWKQRRSLTLPLVVYTVVAVVLILGYSAVGTRPRMVLGVLPGFVWLAGWLRPRAFTAVALGCVPLLFAVTYLWAWRVVP